MNVVKDFVVPAAVLTAICLVVSAALAGTYGMTEPIIEAAKRAEADAARVVVLPGGSDFREVTVSGVDNIVDAYEAGNGAGYVITGIGKGGYGGDLQVMAGIDKDGKITAVKLMDNNETTGIGSKTGEDAYTSQYKGKDSTTLDEVNAVSGATISSTAFKGAVTNIFQAYGKLAGVEIAAPEVVPPENIIFPDVTEFTEITVDGAKKAYQAGDAGIILVMEGKGYSNAPTPMEIYVGIGPDGKIVGVAAGENSETPGLGGEVLKQDYLSAYAGKDIADGVDARSGSTETSVGVKKLVQAALDLVPGLMGDAAPAGDGAEIIGGADGETDIVVADGAGVFTASAAGFGGDVTATVTIDADGKIVSVAVDVSKETEGLGSRAGEAAYTDSWVGLGAGEAPDAISGATVTSNAVKAAVDAAFAAYEAAKGA